jgi:hypothetical protein
LVFSGLIVGILNTFIGMNFDVKEVDFWCTVTGSAVLKQKELRKAAVESHLLQYQWLEVNEI